MPGGDVVAALAYAGIGTALGSAAAAVITGRYGRHEARATAVHLITDAAGDLASGQSAMIDRLERRLDRQAAAIIALVTVVDEALPHMVLGDVERAELVRVIAAAKIAL